MAKLANIFKTIFPMLYVLIMNSLNISLPLKTTSFRGFMLKIKIKRIGDAKLPSMPTKAISPGVDLYSTEEYVLKPMERKLIGTGIKLQSHTDTKRR